MTGPEMERYLEERSMDYSAEKRIAELLEWGKKMELTARYAEMDKKIIMERHKKAFEYLNGLYMRVVAKNKELKADCDEWEAMHNALLAQSKEAISHWKRDQK